VGVGVVVVLVVAMLGEATMPRDAAASCAGTQ
jgi:hypothetical protein